MMRSSTSSSCSSAGPACNAPKQASAVRRRQRSHRCRRLRLPNVLFIPTSLARTEIRLFGTDHPHHEKGQFVPSRVGHSTHVMVA